MIKMSIDRIHGKDITPETIWMCRQNIPELIVQDAVQEFGLSEEQAERMRKILLIRGVNKWFYARRKLIKFKHVVKDMLKTEIYRGEDKRKINLLHYINSNLQNIAKTPRWIEWPETTTHSWDEIKSKIVVKGKKC